MENDRTGKRETPDAVQAAAEIGAKLAERGIDYAIGGALALDLADIDAILRAQGDRLDRTWVERQIEQLFGPRDPRLARWKEIVAAIG